MIVKPARLQELIKTTGTLLADEEVENAGVAALDVGSYDLQCRHHA